MITKTDLIHLHRCIALANEALIAGDKPFGSVLVSEDGEVLFEDRNRTVTLDDATCHPEISIARWAAKNLSANQRKNAVVYTSGEHCAMCSAAHGWVGLGRIVYVSSSKQVGKWLSDLGVPPAPINAIPITEIIPDLQVEGPIAELDEQVRALHYQFYEIK